MPEVRDHPEISDALDHLRTQTRRGSFEDTVVAELQVLRASLVRVATAVTGDKLMGADGLVATTRKLDTRVELLEQHNAAEVTEKKTTAKNLAMIASVASVVSGLLFAALQWLAR